MSDMLASMPALKEERKAGLYSSPYRDVIRAKIILLAAQDFSNRIAGAGVDVLTEKPPKRGNVLLDQEIPNLIVTPHVAWASVESRQRLLNQVAENVQAFLDGVPQNIVLP